MQRAFEVLADRHRREILDLLRDGEQRSGDVATRLALAQPSASKHLKVLREASLVQVRTDAQRRWYRLRSEPLRAIDAWIEPYRQLWTDRLDALEQHLDTMPDGPDTKEDQ